MAEHLENSAAVRETDRGYVDLGAVIAGAVIAVAAGIVLAGFSAALGLGSISFGEEGSSAFGLILTALFTVVSVVLVYMLGGYIAGRMRRRVEPANSAEVVVRDGLHGLIVWGLGAILTAIAFSGAVTGGAKVVGETASVAVEATGSAVGGIAQGAGDLVSGAVSGAGSAIGGTAQGLGQAAAPTLEQALPDGLQANPLDYITDRLFRRDNAPAIELGQSGNADGGDAKTEAGRIILNSLHDGELSDEDRAYLQRIIARETGLSTSEVDKRITQMEDRVTQLHEDAQKKLDEAKEKAEELKAEAEKAAQEAKDKAEEIAENARVAGVLTAFLLAASALVAAAAAYIGAVRGGQHRDEGRIWGGLNYRPRR